MHTLPPVTAPAAPRISEKFLAVQVAAANFWGMQHTEMPEPPAPPRDIVDLAMRYLPNMESYVLASDEFAEAGEYQAAAEAVAKAIRALGIEPLFA